MHLFYLSKSYSVGGFVVGAHHAGGGDNKFAVSVVDGVDSFDDFFFVGGEELELFRLVLGKFETAYR